MFSRAAHFIRQPGLVQGLAGAGPRRNGRRV